MAEEIGKKSVKHPGSENLTPGGPGRPKGRKNFATLYREAIEKIALSTGTEPDQFELEIVEQALRKARNGDIRFYTDTMDRLHGKAVNKTELTGKDGGPVQYEDLSELSDEELAKLTATSESGDGKA